MSGGAVLCALIAPGRRTRGLSFPLSGSNRMVMGWGSRVGLGARAVPQIARGSQAAQVRFWYKVLPSKRVVRACCLEQSLWCSLEVGCEEGGRVGSGKSGEGDERVVARCHIAAASACAADTTLCRRRAYTQYNRYVCMHSPPGRADVHNISRTR